MATVTTKLEDMLALPPGHGEDAAEMHQRPLGQTGDRPPANSRDERCPTHDFLRRYASESQRRLPWRQPSIARIRITRIRARQCA